MTTGLGGRDAKGDANARPWRVLGAKRTRVSPLLRADKTWDRTVLRHGTEDLGPLLVDEQVIGAVARLRSGRQLKIRLHDTLSHA